MLFSHTFILGLFVSLTQSQSFALPAPDASALSTTPEDSVPQPTSAFTPLTTQIQVPTVRRLFKSGTISGNPSRSHEKKFVIAGSATPTSPGAGGKAIKATPKPNTRPCNGHSEFCTRKYMNVTEVGAHNAAFVRQHNAAANQEIPILGQLNDGVRMIQGETIPLDGVMHSCHTDCALFNAGTLKDQLTTIRKWVVKHPYDVLTLLFVNRKFVDVDQYVGPILDAGLGPFLYHPPKIPMHREDWPTYGQMMVSGKRVVIFLDYKANQTKVPFILDQFQHMWETPFSPTDMNFPCDQQRPGPLNSVQQNLVPYLANHNLNVKVSLGSTAIDIPNFATLSQVNSLNGLKGLNATGSLGKMGDDCTKRWGRAPAWLLVDFYNYGDKNGSVFEVASKLNGVKYTKKCCGENTSVSSKASGSFSRPTMGSVFGLIVAMGFLILSVP